MICFKCKKNLGHNGYNVGNYECNKCDLHICLYKDKIIYVRFLSESRSHDYQFAYEAHINQIYIEDNWKQIYSGDATYFLSLEYEEAGKYILKLIDNLAFI